MQIKAGVSLKGLQPETLVGVMVANEIIKEVGRPFVITSVMDGKHKEGSQHYKGYAFDIRTRVFASNEVIDKVARDLRVRLNGEDSNFVGEWDVVVEGTHIHCEFDPA